MKHYLRSLIIAAISFYIAYSLVPTISLGKNLQNALLVVGSIFVTNLIIHPVFSIILLPINIITFGLLSLILNIVLIFVLTKFLPSFAIAAYNFPGVNIQGFIIPPVSLNQIETLLAVAIIITIVQKILHIIFE